MRKPTITADIVRHRAKRNQAFEELRSRVEAAWACVSVLRPDLTPAGKEKLAQKVLDACASFVPDAAAAPIRQITAAQVTSIVWTNSQCIQKSCPMLLFSDRIAAELNAFFNEPE